MFGSVRVKVGEKSGGESDNKNIKNEGTNKVTYNLTVFGNSAPLVSKDISPKFPKVRRSVNTRPTPKKQDLPLPIDKILLLAERLCLMEEGKEMLESTTFETPRDTWEDKKFSVSQETEVCWTKATDVHPEAIDINIPIDLSSLINDESDNSEGCAGYKLLKEDLGSTLRLEDYPENVSQTGQSFELDDFPKVQVYEPETSWPGVASMSDKHTKPITEKSTSDDDERDVSDTQDLICVYVSGVTQENNLQRYLRPCQKCNETCCGCTRVCSTRKTSSLKKSLTNLAVSKERCKIDKKIETDGTITGLEFTKLNVRKPPNITSKCINHSKTRHTGCEYSTQRSCPESSYECLGISDDRHEHPKHYCNCLSDRVFDSGINSPKVDRNADSIKVDFTTLQDSVVTRRGLLSNTHLSYTSSLAKAAQSARELANDLESVLRVLNIDSQPF